MPEAMIQHRGLGVYYPQVGPDHPCRDCGAEVYWNERRERYIEASTDLPHSCRVRAQRRARRNATGRVRELRGRKVQPRAVAPPRPNATVDL